MIFTTDDIITSVKARTLAPTGQPTYQNADFIRFANEEFLIKLVPDMITIREDFFLNTQDYTVSTNQTAYTMPERTLGNTLKDLFYIDTSGNRFVLSRININDIPLNNFVSVYPSNFYIKGDQVIFAPAPFPAGTIEMWFYQRPNELVLTSACGQITAIALDTPIAGQVTYTVNADISSYDSVDVLSGKSPFVLWGQSLTPVSATSTTMVLTMSELQNEAGTMLPVVGDYICLEQQACIPMIPQEFHPLLAEMVAARVMQGLGHDAKLDKVNENIQVMRQNLLNMIANRIEQKPEAIKNRFGLVNNSGYGWATGWWR